MSDMTLPNDHPIVPTSMYDARQVVRLAREIAMGMLDIDEILDNLKMSRADFEELQRDPRFNKVLASELADWTGAGNTQERLKVKSAAMIEDFLPELYVRMNDPNEPLMAKAKMLDFIAKMAGYGNDASGKELKPGDRVVVQINLGADNQLNYEKRLPSKVIDHTPSVEESV